jgi:Uma2 family endonuclease
MALPKDFFSPETETDLVQRADWLTQKPQGSWTYDDYVALPEDGNRYEIIDGVIYRIPMPETIHQACSVRIAYYFFESVDLANVGYVLTAPMDVKLSSGTTVQPDLIVVLNHKLSIITDANINGTPDLLVEILSPGTKTYDRTKKLQTYQKNTVPEYWIANPKTKEVEVLVLENGVYRSLGVFSGQATLPSQVLPNFPPTVNQLFL